ncbi:MAG: DUF4412 domain-containing protein, partial [Desulfovibrionales bacterium]
MRGLTIVVLGVVFMCVTSAPGLAGFVQKERDGSSILIQDGKLKVVPSEQDEPWFIADMKGDRLTMGDPTARQYATGTTAEYCQMMEKMMGAMSAFMGENPMQGDTPAQVKVVKDGSGGTIAGYDTTKYTILENGQRSEEIWLTEDSAILKELGSLENMEFMECGTGSAALATSEEYSRLMGKGWPLKSISYFNGEADVDSDVVSLEKKNIPDSEFQPPKGMKQVSFAQLFELEPEGRGMEEEVEEGGFGMG